LLDKFEDKGKSDGSEVMQKERKELDHGLRSFATFGTEK
jgi:hypothetical protein